jgi:protein PhnA
MTIKKALEQRSGSQCELCGQTEHLEVYEVAPSNGSTDECVLLCKTCREQINDPDKVDVNHWRCLNDSMWSQVPAVQVMSWRMLSRLSSEGWPQDLLDMLYLDEEILAWAQALKPDEADDGGVTHLDCNGVVLHSGDTVIITKDLNVKGTSMTAKRGTAVRGISLITDNAGQIEGRVNGQQIVILTQFVKKSA